MEIKVGPGSSVAVGSGKIDVYAGEGIRAQGLGPDC